MCENLGVAELSVIIIYLTFCRKIGDAKLHTNSPELAKKNKKGDWEEVVKIKSEQGRRICLLVSTNASPIPMCHSPYLHLMAKATSLQSIK